MDIKNAQRKLGLTPDGVLGPVTWAALFSFCGAKPPLAAAFGQTMANAGKDIGTPLEACHFLAQSGHETEGFRYLTELGGPTYCAKYDGRKDLGNLRPGDGYRFRGRGIFQITGRANYSVMAAKVGVDLIAEPDRASEPGIAVLTALIYWRSRGLSVLAANDDCLGITKKINGGFNGLADRQERLAKLRALFA